VDVNQIRETVRVLHEAQRKLESLEQELVKNGEATPGSPPDSPPPTDASPAPGGLPLQLDDLEAFLDQLNDAELNFFLQELKMLLLQVEATRQLEADLIDAGVL
jgi:hypothetical protein